MAFPVSPTNGQTAVVNNITYQFSNVGNTWTRILSTANIITANTLVSNGLISAVGNVSGNYILGNGSQLTGISINPSNIASGTSNVSIVSAGGNATVNIGGTSNVAVFATTGEYITGVLSANGNVTGGNLLTAGAISATGTLSVSGNTTVANVSAGNISAGSLSTSGLISATANVTGGNLLTGGLISSTGTITGSSHLGSVVSVTANVTGGNILTAGQISATGNITGSYFLGNGSALTGIIPGGNTTFSNSAPVSPAVGDVWVQGNTAIQYLYFNDGTSSQWAEMEAYQSFSGSGGSTGASNVSIRAQAMTMSIILGS